MTNTANTTQITSQNTEQDPEGPAAARVSDTAPGSDDARGSAASAIRLVAGREISSRVRTRSFVVSTVLTLLVVILGGIFLPRFLGDDGPDTERIAVQGMSPEVVAAVEQAGNQVGVTLEPDTSEDARKAAESGDVTAGIVAEEGGVIRVYSEKTLDPEVEAAIRGGVSSAAMSAELAARGVDVASLPGGPEVTLERTDGTDESHGERVAMAMAGTFLLFMVVLGGGLAVAMGVVEEKVSRIVEILLATITPAQLLWGKILGVGVVQIASTALFAGAVLATSLATGLLTVPNVAYAVVGVSLVFLVLGYLFFASLYAAAGSMVSRQEEVNSVSWPLMLVAMGALYASMFGVQNPDSTLMQVLAWLPPFSATVVPMRVAIGVASTTEVVGSALVMAIATGIAVWIAGYIYKRAILHTGARVSWKAALSR